MDYDHTQKEKLKYKNLAEKSVPHGYLGCAWFYFSNFYNL